MSELITKLNQAHATFVDFYFQYKHFHWHYRGPDFYQFHKLFDKHASMIFPVIDLNAERIRQLDGHVITDLQNLGSASILTQVNDSKDFDSQTYILPHLHNNHLIVIKDLKEIIVMADEQNDPSTSDMVIKFLQDHELMNWFIKSYMLPDNKA